MFFEMRGTRSPEVIKRRMPRPSASKKSTKQASRGLDPAVRSTLASYLHDVRSLPNESAKTHRFAALVSELFPGSNAIRELVAGIEKRVRIVSPAGSTRGRINSYYGNAVIEFENSLKATEEIALRQLREYTLGLWAAEKGKHRPLVCIASDGVVWKVFVPGLKAGQKGKPTSAAVELELLRTITVSDDSASLHDFWIWLTSLLFRASRTDPSAERFRVDFGATSPALVDAMDALRGAWGKLRGSSESQLAFATWQKYLTVTYGRLGDAGRLSELQELFLKHTYLASVARLLIWAALSGGKTTQTLRAVARDVFSGSFFEAQGIENFVEGDFFQWVLRPEAEPTLAPVWERILDQMLTYALDRIDQDVLKGVYQDLVDPKDRHDLGEYYTPEWLCERMAAEVLPATGFASVLDPTCGSGSFLRATIAHLLGHNASGGPATRLRSILDNVAGIDIHPLAVTIARATYLLAIRGLVGTSKRQIQIPVYLADALFLPSEVTAPHFGEAAGYMIRFGDKSVSVPDELVRAPDLFDPAIAGCTEVAKDHASTKAETLASLHAYLTKAVPDLAARSDFPAIVSALWTFTEELADLIRKKKNAIWAFIIRNAYRPAMFRGRFQYIIGNPPWLSYRYIVDPEYQKEVKKRAVKEYQVAPKSQKLMTQMELALVFLVHTLTAFGRPGSRLAFVMPRSVLTGDQHSNFRSGSYSAPVRVDGYWDLLEVRPLFNVPACVVFATRAAEAFGPRGRVPEVMPAIEWRGKLFHRDAPLAEATQHLSCESKTARLLALGSRTALSTKEGPTKTARRSFYAALFRQGATIVPRNFYFVSVRDLDGRPDPDRVYWAETDLKQGESAKPPYQDVHLKGHVEGRFIFSTALSKHLLPFQLLQPPTIVLPILTGKTWISFRTASQLRSEGYREMAKWMENAECIWKIKRKEKAARQTVYQWLDYQKKLSTQNFANPHLVVYNAAGTNLSAAAVDRRTLSTPFLVEHKLYWASFKTQEEADYLAAILNAQTINDAIKPFQSMGLLGERDIEKKVLDLPIPRYNERNATHRNLAGLGARARTEAVAVAGAADFPTSLVKRRAIVRNGLASTLKEIDAIVREILVA